MPGELSKQFHKQTDLEFIASSFRSDCRHQPGSWNEIYTKEYSRMEKIPLPKNFLDIGNMEKAMKNRHSCREYNLGKIITKDELSTLLFYSAGVNPGSQRDRIKRFYPSEGALYPLEVYLAIQKVEGISQGIYHYNVKNHTLEKLTEGISELDKIKEGLLYKWSREAPVMVFITSVWNRNMLKYGNRGYRAILLEAGHLAQNLSLVASALDIGCCNYMGFNNKLVNEVLDIINDDEDSLYMALLGK
ncbi:MAG TPA: SagB/ThcOx family dehydrogenase [Candidatus Moranbacteria bacterium]|mgnify:CR=1 FL=1|nr:SagB/ThcOx family dehydrogenase [Candidatus Moranbacteria bacterium]